MKSTHPQLRSVCSWFVFVLVVSASVGNYLGAEQFYVSPSGSNDNDGSKKSPWQTISFACLQLNPGDTLNIEGGTYGNGGSEGNILLRFQDPDSGDLLPLEGNSRRVTRIRPASRWQRPRIYGSLDIRGSHITVSGLEFVSDRSSNAPGIVAYESHNIQIFDNIVHEHGGGGINFNQCDLVRAERNICYGNANRNPDQHSGISSYQPIVRTSLREKKLGVIFRDNICFNNRNVVTTPEGSITDGNGIAIDDHMYFQTNDIILAAMEGESHSELSSGDPVIFVNNDETPRPYSRRSLVENNLCFHNGGRGVSVYLAENVVIRNNTLLFNLLSSEFVEQTPRDPETNQPYFYQGEITVIDCNKVFSRNNLALAFNSEIVAAGEHFFEVQPKNRTSENFYRQNKFINFANLFRSINVFGADRSDLLFFRGY